MGGGGGSSIIVVLMYVGEVLMYVGSAYTVGVTVSTYVGWLYIGSATYVEPYPEEYPV